MDSGADSFELIHLLRMIEAGKHLAKEVWT
jgi:hypothetical protein